jgi:hypothetical protein
MDQFFSPDFLKFFLPLAGAVLDWILNARRNRAWEEYRRKEDRYQQLLSALQGFYVGSESREQKARFLEQVNLCWLYCPDGVIRAAYSFLQTIGSGPPCSDERKEEALGALVMAIRRDLLSRKLVRDTALTSRDFRVLSPR